MTNLPQTIDEKSEAVLQKVQSQMDEWRAALNTFEEKLKEATAETQAAYEEQLAQLKLHWQQVESRFGALQQAEDAQRGVAYADWRETAVSYDKAFMSTVSNMKEYVPLGWLQGFTDKRIQDSQGWAEGFGKRPESSEGFAEGMGHMSHETSKGWAEGYNKTSKS